MSAVDWLDIAFRALIVAGAFGWFSWAIYTVRRAPPGERRAYFMHGEKQEVPPVWHAFFAAVLLLYGLFEFGRPSDCYIDWDGRSNPTVCDTASWTP